MVVLIVTGSMREPPLNCDIRGLERMFPLLKRDQYRKFKSRLGLEADPYPNQSVNINKTAAEVLTLLTDFGFTVAAQSQDSAGNFITWTLVRKEPFLIIRRDYAKRVDSVNNNFEPNESEPLSSNILEKKTYVDQ